MKDYTSIYKKAQNAFVNNNLKVALKFCNICKKTNPQDAAVWALLGAIYGKGQNYIEAEKCYRKATEIKPDLCEAWYFLAVSNVFQGNVNEQTISYFDKALELNSKYIPALTGKACLLRDLGQTEKAISIFDQALFYDPNNVEALLNKGTILKNIGKYKESVACFEQIILRNPGHYPAMAGKAIACYYMGEFDRANDIILKVIKSGVIDPLVAQAYAEISKNNKNITDALGYIEKVIEEGSAMYIENDELHYKAAALYDKTGNYEKAFEHINNANKRKSNMFDVGHYSRYLENMKKIFTSEFINERKLDISNNIRPIFIVGMPRSGSSLLEQVLSCHPEVSAAGELTAVLDILTKATGVNAKTEKIPQIFAELDKKQLEAIANEYYNLLKASANNKIYVTDKLPTNYERIGMIRILFPDASIIHIRRNSLDTCVSCLFQNFGNNHIYVTNMEKLGQVYSLYSELMDYWNRLPESHIHEVSYEDMVHSPKETISSVLKYCGLEWSDKCLEFHKSERLTKTASYDQVRQPLYRSSIDRWKNYEKYIRPLMDQLESKRHCH